VKVVTKVKKEKIISKSIIYRNFKDIDRSEFASDITNIKIGSESITEYVELFESVMKAIVDKHAPEIKKNKQLFFEIRSHGLLRV